MPETKEFQAAFEPLSRPDRCSLCYGNNTPAVVKFVKTYPNGEPRNGKHYADNNLFKPRKTQAWWLCQKHAESLSERFGIEIPMEVCDASSRTEIG